MHFFTKFDSFVEYVSIGTVLLPVKWDIVSESHFVKFKFVILRD